MGLKSNARTSDSTNMSPSFSTPYLLHEEQLHIQYEFSRARSWFLEKQPLRRAWLTLGVDVCQESQVAEKQHASVKGAI